MRCIEISSVGAVKMKSLWINRNMRCIEIDITQNADQNTQRLIET